MLPHRVSNPGPLTYKSGALPIGLRGPAASVKITLVKSINVNGYTFRKSNSAIFSPFPVGVNS